MKLVYLFLYILLFSSVTYGQKNTLDKDDVTIKYDSKKGKFGLETHAGKKIIPPKYDYIEYYADEQVALAKSKFKWSFIILPDKEKIPLSYDEVRHYNGSLFIVGEKGEYGLIDKYGKEILSLSLDKIYAPTYGLAITKKNNFYGFLNLNGKIIVPARYDNIDIIKNRVFITSLKNKFGLFSSNGNEIISPTYDDIQLLDEDSYRILVNNKYGVLDKNGIISINPQFDYIYSFNKNLYSFQNNNKVGLISKVGKELAPAKYDQILYNDYDNAYAYLNGEKGTISLSDGKFTKINSLSVSDTMSFDDDPKIFDSIVEEEATYLEGTNALINFIATNLKYPEKAMEKGTQGRVISKFVVEKDGTISNIRIIKDIGDGCGEEVIRVLKLSKKWNPATINGKPVRSHFRLPVKFSIPQN